MATNSDATALIAEFPAGHLGAAALGEAGERIKQNPNGADRADGCERKGTLPLCSWRLPRGHWDEGVNSKTLRPGARNCLARETGTQQGNSTVRTRRSGDRLRLGPGDGRVPPRGSRTARSVGRNPSERTCQMHRPGFLKLSFTFLPRFQRGPPWG